MLHQGYVLVSQCSETTRCKQIKMGRVGECCFIISGIINKDDYVVKNTSS